MVICLNHYLSTHLLTRGLLPPINPPQALPESPHHHLGFGGGSGETQKTRGQSSDQSTQPRRMWYVLSFGILSGFINDECLQRKDQLSRRPDDLLQPVKPSLTTSSTPTPPTPEPMLQPAKSPLTQEPETFLKSRKRFAKTLRLTSDQLVR